MSELRKPLHGSALGRTWPIVWLIFLSLLFVSGWYKSSINRRDQQALIQWKAHIDELKKHSQIEWNNRLARIRASQMLADSMQKMELEFNNGQPLDLKTEGKYQIFDWSHPEYGGELQLRFDNGVLVGHRARWGTGQVEQLHPRPVQRGYLGWTESWRLALIGPSPEVWLGAFVAIFVLRNYQLMLGLVMLAAALTYGAAQLVNPRYSITWQGIFSNDSLFLAIPMIALAVAVISHALATEGTAIRPQYSLRLLFFVMTTISLMLAAGAFGQVVLAVALLSLLLAGYVYIFVRSKLSASVEST